MSIADFPALMAKNDSEPSSLQVYWPMLGLLKAIPKRQGVVKQIGRQRQKK